GAMLPVDWIIVPSCGVGLVAALFQFLIIKKIKLQPDDDSEASTDLKKRLMAGGENAPEKLVPEIYEKIMSGAKQFLRVEYAICMGFCLIFSLVIYGLV
ncbi:unnamed protein product, partial [Symbiodinium necroappetens]